MKGSRKASVDWTIGKLMTIILGLIVFVMVVYGISTQAFVPLFERTGTVMDSVKALIPFIGSDGRDACTVREVRDLSGGDIFLDRFYDEGDESSEVLLRVCEDGTCRLESKSFGEYAIRDGRIVQTNPDTGESTSRRIFERDLDGVAFNHRVFGAAYTSLQETNAREFYRKRFTDSFELRSNGAGFGDEVYAEWRNGYWIVFEGEFPVGYRTHGTSGSDTNILYEGTEDGIALETFYEQVSGSVGVGADDVFYSGPAVAYVLSGQGSSRKVVDEPIGSVVGDLGFLYNPYNFVNRLLDSSIDVFRESLDPSRSYDTFDSGLTYNKLDSDEEFENLLEFFEHAKLRLVEETLPTEAEVAVLKSSLEGLGFSVNGESFVFGLVEEELYPVVAFSSDQVLYGLRYSGRALGPGTWIEILDLPSDEVRGFKDDFPLVLATLRGGVFEEVGTEAYYKLPDDVHDTLYKGSLAYGYLINKCGDEDGT